jgi:hypothetical protein
MIKYFLSFAFWAVLASNASAQFTPLIAKMRQTDETLAGGKVVKTVERDALYYRTSDGSYVLRWTSASKDGETQALHSGGLWDNKTGTSYKLDYQNMRATVEDIGRPPMQPDVSNDSEKGLPQDSVHGIRCTVYPVKMKQPSGADLRAGQLCTSTEHHLILKQELNYPTTGGQSVHSSMELYDVQLGTEPDPKLFDVAHSFTVYEPTPKKN